MSQSIEVLDQRTQRDLKFVETMEIQLKSLEIKFREVENGHESSVARQYKVTHAGRPRPLQRRWLSLAEQVDTDVKSLSF